MPKVGLDTGHFLNCYRLTGAKGTKYGNNQIFEEYNDFNVHVARELKEQLEHNGFKIVVTQELSGSAQRSLQYRTDLANKEKVDLFVSIHANAGSKDAHGACGFYWENSRKLSKIPMNFEKNDNSIPKIP